jgi:pyruvate,water dikinase
MRHLLSLVQRFMRIRERLRSHVVTVLGLYRAVALDASRRLRVTEPSAGEDAAFYVTVEELHAFLRGDVSTLAPLIRRRRLQLERDRALPDPPDSFVGFPPPPAPIAHDADALVGLAACSGLARGKARVLHDPAEAAELRVGEILVAPYADVGWSPLFLVAAAVVTDLGGPLSHASVVAREYGVPTVVNVKNASKILRSGDEVEVDGTAGTVRVIARVAAPVADHAP